MTKEELQSFMRFLKKRKIKAGQVAERLPITESYLSDMKRGSRPITDSFVKQLKEGYPREWKAFNTLEVEKTEKTPARAPASSLLPDLQQELTLTQISIALKVLAEAVSRIDHNKSSMQPGETGMKRMRQFRSQAARLDKGTISKKGKSGKG